MVISICSRKTKQRIILNTVHFTKCHIYFMPTSTNMVLFYSSVSGRVITYMLPMLLLQILTNAQRMANSVSMATVLTNRVPTSVDVMMATNCHQMAPTAWVNINHFEPTFPQAKFAEDHFFSKFHFPHPTKQLHYTRGRPKEIYIFCTVNERHQLISSLAVFQ